MSENLENIAKNTPAKKEATEVENLKAESVRLENEARKLELLERQANLQDLQERLAERELARETKRQRNKINGATLKSIAEGDRIVQKNCTHKKGGDGAAAVVHGKGQSSQYAVLKHTFANGDMWIRCLRCGSTWKPPLREDYNDEAAFLKACVEYETAKNFSTLNVASSGCLFKFSDNGQYYREVTRNTTLR